MFFWSKKKEQIEFKLPMKDIKERANILFIDNEEVPLIETLQLEGWHVEHWIEVKSLKELEDGKFDLIFLDIGGIGKEYCPDEEGFGILKRIKTVNPSILIVAFSGLSFDATRAEFWALADATLSKSSGAIKAIELLEELLKKKYNSKELWNDFQQLLNINGYDPKCIKEIEKIIFDSGSNKESLEKLKKALQLASLSATSFNALLNIGSKIISIIKLVNG